MDHELADLATFYDFLVTLDCRNTTKSALKQEEALFDADPKREIAAFVCQQTSEKLQFTTGYVRILYVLEGSITLTIDHETNVYPQGSLLLATNKTQVEYYLAPDAKTLHFYFKKGYFTDSLLAQFAEETRLYRFFAEAVSSDDQALSRYYLFDFTTSNDIHFYTLLLLKQIVKMRYFNNKLTKSAFVLLIVEISQDASRAIIKRDTHVSNANLVDEIGAYLEHHLATVTLAQTAAYFHFHPNYLSHLLKERTNQTFTELLLTKRILFAKNYLTETSLPIQAIIERIGYQDKAFFYKRFKENVGMTPREYRQSNKEE